MTSYLARNEHGYILLAFGPAEEHRLDHDHGYPVMASFVVVERHGSVLLVFDNWRQHWELPGGSRHLGESPRTAAVRELFEETGVQTEELDFVGVSSYQSPGGLNERVAVFRTTLAFDTPDPVPVFQTNDEIGAVRWWDPAGLRDGIDSLDATIIDRVLADEDVHPSPLDVTRSTYQAAADRYAQRSRATVAGSGSPVLDQVAELLPGGRLLEIGSGPGWDADYLEQQGLVVQRSDITPAFVELMQAGGHDARILDVRTDDLGGPWDGVLANAVLLHLTRSEFAAVVARVADAVRPGGLFAFTLKEGDGEGWSEAKLELPRWFVYWREPELRSVVEAAGWTVLWLEHADDRPDNWLNIIAQR